MKCSISILLFAFVFSATAHAQPNPKQTFIDSLALDICNRIDTSHLDSDTARVLSALRQGVNSVKNFEGKESAILKQALYLRLRHNCLEFYDFVGKYLPHSKSWKLTSTLPEPHMNAADLKAFSEYKKFSYIDGNDSIVQLDFANNYWIDHFSDSTYSKLSVHWMDEKTFYISFIESNNNMRRLYSIAGDRYVYHLLEKTDKYFKVATNIEGRQRYTLFNLYYTDIDQ
ncbi:MAG TPA: hypothetical protein VL053_00355 [Arachidicoccus sp.]|nr:hypothetical protein [Arachidicoccus sp.]